MRAQQMTHAAVAAPTRTRRPASAAKRQLTVTITHAAARVGACRIKHLGEADPEVLPRAATGVPPHGRPAYRQPNDDVMSGGHGSDRVAA
jgi:hypothetical protein